MSAPPAWANLARSPGVRVFIAEEALAAGLVTRYGLAADHRRLFPGVSTSSRTPLTLDDRIVAAWLWSRRRGIVSGLAASALHGAQWVAPDIVIELNLAHNKSPSGITTRRDTLVAGEITQVRGIACTTVERTAFDLARRGKIGKAVERLDALARAERFEADAVIAVRDVHPRLRGRRRAQRVLDLVDPGAQSPRETWLRLLLTEAGFPRPQTQIPVLEPDGFPR